MSETRSAPPATVVICTRDRGAKITATMESVIASTESDFDILIIDQSAGDETELAVAPFLSDDRVRYLRSSATGVARSRTLALHEARTEFVLNTDDDCVVDPDWVAANLRAFAAHPNAAIVFGDVLTPNDADADGYAPESVAESGFVVRSIWSWKNTDGVNVGIGASMAMRRSVLIGLGGFDHELGPGTALRNAEDTDMTLRTLLAGHEIVRVTDARVDHYGHRSHDEFRELTRGAMLGIGAMSGKLIRRHPVAISRFFSGVVYRLVVRTAVIDLAHGRKPPVLGRATYLAKGFWKGLRRPIVTSPGLLFAPAADDAASRPPGPIRVTLMTEQHVGLKTYSDNLQRFVDADERITPTWVPITYVQSGGFIERLRFLPPGVRGSLRGRAQVRSAVRRTDPHACLYLTQVPAALGGRLARRVPFVIIADDTPKLFDAMADHYDATSREPAPLRWLKHRANVAALRRATAVLPMSEWAKRSFVDDYGVDPTRVIVVPTGIDLDAWAPPEQVPGDDRPLRMLFVGGHFVRKGGDTLLQAFERLEPGTAELHVVTREIVEQRPGVHVHTGLHANTPELIALFHQADVFVLASRAEAFPNVVVEACAAGLACIVTDVGGMAEMVTDGTTGLVVKPDDVDALTAALQQLVDDRDRCRQMGHAARRRALAAFDGRTNAARIVDIIVDAV